MKSIVLLHCQVVRSELRCCSKSVGGTAGGSAPLQEHWRRQERMHLIQQMEQLREKVNHYSTYQLFGINACN